MNEFFCYSHELLSQKKCITYFDRVLNTPLGKNLLKVKNKSASLRVDVARQLLMPAGNKRSYALKQTCSFQLQVCLSKYDLLLQPGIKELTIFAKKALPEMFVRVLNEHIFVYFDHVRACLLKMQVVYE